MEDEDYLLALKLQEEFDREANLHEYDMEAQSVNKVIKRSRNNYDNESDDDDDKDSNDDLNRTQNIVHPQWETLDPTPDAKALFNAFDNKFFQGRLKCVELEWSKRMYSCAGICYTRRNRMGMAITIRLSEPLLKLRSRKDLIETLLHEMIHAYCGILGIREGNGGHGPNFKKIMNGINKVAGTNITVYHNFHDEVNIYKTHWWRCNGICQNRSPFFGYVKRTSNRAPGPNDIWWKQHLQSCGGSFLKIKEPERKRKIKTKDEIKNKENIIKLKNNNTNTNIKKYFSPIPNKENNNNLNPLVSHKPGNTESSRGGASGNLNNVIGFKDITEGNVNAKAKSSSSINTMFGTGYSLTATSQIIDSPTKKQGKTAAQELRDIWANKYPSESSSPTCTINTKNNKNETDIINLGASTSAAAIQNDNKKNDNDDTGECNEPKKRRLSATIIDDIDDESSRITTKSYDSGTWTIVDDEIMIKESNDSVINIIDSSSEDEDTDDNEDNKISSSKVIKKEDNPSERKSSLDRQREIKKEIFESNKLNDDSLTEDDIELIDDEYDDVLSTVDENETNLITETSLVDDLFGEDTLLKDFKKENDVVSSGTKYHRNSLKDIIVCPICEERVIRENLSDHLDGCIGITVKVIPKPGPSTSKLAKKISNNTRKIPSSSSSSISSNIALNLDSSEDSDSTPITTQQTPNDMSEGLLRRRGLVTSTHACPVCAQEVDIDRINEHLDVCLMP